MVLNITTREHAGDIRAGGIRLGFDITETVEIDLALEDICVWIVPDCDK